MRTTTTRALAGLALAGLLVGPTGCSDDPEQPSGAVATTDAPTPSPQVAPELPELPEVEGSRGGVSALSLGDCGPVEGTRARVRGTLTSSAGRRADWLVTVTWTDATGEVRGRGFQVLRDVPPGAERAVRITAEVADGAETCVPGVLYGAIAAD